MELKYLLYTSAALVSLPHANAQEAKSERPNIIFILSDDHRYDAFSFMNPEYTCTPNLDQLRANGAHMANAFSVISLSGPSRASILTGVYPQVNGVTGNAQGREFDSDVTPSFGEQLQEAGYSTAYIGKWHMAHHDEPRRGWDYWVSFVGQGNYYGNDLNINGERVRNEGYITTELTNYALNFIKEQSEDKPYLLYLSHKAVHEHFTPEPKYKEKFQGVTIPTPPEAMDKLSGKPDWQRTQGGDKLFYDRRGYEMDHVDSIQLRRWDQGQLLERQLNQYRTLITVDDGVGEIIELLKERGELENTIIIYGGDNGYLHGEHDRSDKRVAYDESIRVPLLIQYPKMIEPNTTVNEMVLWTDIAPTLLELAEVEPNAQHQGLSLVSLFDGEEEVWRESFLYTYWKDLVRTIPTMTAVRTDRYTYVEYPNSGYDGELYDHDSDPHELNNLYNNPTQESVQRDLAQQLNKLKDSLSYRYNVPRVVNYSKKRYPIGELYSCFSEKSIPRSIESTPKLSPAYGVYEVSMRVKVAGDGPLLSHSAKGGYVIYCDNGGRVGAVHSDSASRRVFLDDTTSVIGKTVDIRVVIDNNRCEFKLYVDSRVAEEKEILLPMNNAPISNIELLTDADLSPVKMTKKGAKSRILKLQINRQ